MATVFIVDDDSGQVIAVLTPPVPSRPGSFQAPPQHDLYLPRSTIDALLAIHGLTPRERAVVLLDLQRLSRGEIAARLSLAPLTVKTYWTRTYTKLGIQRRSQLYQWIREQCEHHTDVYARERAIGARPPHGST